MTLARKACASYQHYLAEQAEKRKKSENVKAEEKAKKEAFQMKTTQVSDEIKEKVKEVSDKKKEESLKRAASSKLFEEANKRRKEGLEKKDFAEIQVAQAVLNSLKNVKEEEKVLKKEIENLDLIIHKKKDRLTNYYKSKQTSTKWVHNNNNNQNLFSKYFIYRVFF